MKSKFLCVTVLAAIAAAAMPCANAQNYPAKPIRLVVPYAPGGSSDVLARALGQRLGEVLGQAVLIDNRPGAGSMIGTDAAAKAAPDGYTLLLADMPHTIVPAVYAKVPYDAAKDFTPVTLIGVAPMFLFVNQAFPLRTLAELIGAAKQAPGKISIASGGNGATTHLMAELLQVKGGIKLTHVPYKGAGPAITDLVAGQVDAAFTSMATAAPYMRSGRLRALGVTSARRVPDAIDIPTFEESGIADMVIEHWWAVLAPAGVPGPILDKLYEAVATSLADPGLKGRFTAAGVMAPARTGPTPLRALIDADLTRWARIVKEAHISAN